MLYDNFVRASRMDPGGNFGQEVQFLRDLVNDKTKSQKKKDSLSNPDVCVSQSKNLKIDSPPH